MSNKTLNQGVTGMALHNTINTLKDLLNKITHDITKAEGGNKAASQRVRTMTVRLEKIAKSYRKESIANEKQNKGSKKSSKKAPVKAKAKAAPAKAAAKPAAKIKAKAAPAKAKSALARPRALSFKKPTAKLPVRRASFR
jgi:Histone H1-like protein Hc1